jgi:hypothetical protein
MVISLLRTPLARALPVEEQCSPSVLPTELLVPRAPALTSDQHGRPSAPRYQHHGVEPLYTGTVVACQHEQWAQQ